jgi:hypothetical protein
MRRNAPFFRTPLDLSLPMCPALGLAGSYSHSVLSRFWSHGPLCSRRRGLAAGSDCDRVASAGARRAARRAADYCGPLHVVVRACRARWDEVTRPPWPRGPRALVLPCPRAPAPPRPRKLPGAVRVVRPAACALWPLENAPFPPERPIIFVCAKAEESIAAQAVVSNHGSRCSANLAGSAQRVAGCARLERR